MNPEEDMLSLLSGVSGGCGSWEAMSTLSPYCVISNTMLQCDIQNYGGMEIPAAYICGSAAE